jgi:putative transposase
VLLVVLWRIRYKLSLSDLVEMFLTRGYEFSHETVRDWEVRFAPLLSAKLKAKRRGQAGKSWYVAAKRFFEQALDTVGHKPDRVTTDQHTAYPQSIPTVLHRSAQPISLSQRRELFRERCVELFTTWKVA